MFCPTIMHPFPITACFHESGAFEMGEVTRHFGLYHSQGIGQFADAGFATRQQVQQAQPRRIGQYLEEEHWLASFGGFFHRLYIRRNVYVSTRSTESV